MAKNKHLDLAHWATEQAVKAGAEGARVSVNKQRYVSMEYRDGRVEKLEEATTNGLNVNLFMNGKYSGHRTSDLRKDALSKFISESVALTTYLTEDAFRRLPDSEFYKGRQDRDIGLVDASYRTVQPEDRHASAKAVEDAARATGGDRIISVTAGYYDSYSESAMVSSNGFLGTQERTDFWAGAEVTAKGKGDKRPSDWWWQGGASKDFVRDPQMIGRKAAERALGRVGSEKIPTETLSVVIENRACGRLLRYLGAAMSGRNLQQRSSFLEGKRGQQVFAPILTITDDPFVKRGQASRLYDQEGLTAKQLPMIEKGVLKNYYIDSYYARKLDDTPTTGSPSNVVFPEGTKSQDEWVRELGRGVLITGFIGGNSNSSTGDFSAGINGFYFEHGSIVKPVSELNIAGNHLEFWKQLVGLGNDPYEFSSLRSPCLVFENVSVAGT